MLLGICEHATRAASSRRVAKCELLPLKERLLHIVLCLRYCWYAEWICLLCSLVHIESCVLLCSPAVA